ncbi:hypothetical protein HYPBUDRAFT_153936 [Hyphopichia burtonii NRRL Y-1933]|uniref:Uncharacterized protein n=1 Tax=Hyphopichia burtonii NRRL Y-1933 TaxID=984485 RepID=A0A1E4RCM5_9ASCO|nr:hypothetical protein HYPBUDRAFT_153936 [Hyphopichia burtonii NRRL Y-1933]ODV65019.1 hypothetical protein HYPBUDRAFT_153936 [Hyphopichia burtonii NRRL Y-1933]
MGIIHIQHTITSIIHIQHTITGIIHIQHTITGIINDTRITSKNIYIYNCETDDLHI